MGYELWEWLCLQKPSQEALPAVVVLIKLCGKLILF